MGSASHFLQYPEETISFSSVLDVRWDKPPSDHLWSFQATSIVDAIAKKTGFPLRVGSPLSIKDGGMSAEAIIVLPSGYAATLDRCMRLSVTVAGQLEATVFGFRLLPGEGAMDTCKAIADHIQNGAPKING